MKPSMGRRNLPGKNPFLQKNTFFSSLTNFLWQTVFSGANQSWRIIVDALLRLRVLARLRLHVGLLADARQASDLDFLSLEWLIEQRLRVLFPLTLTILDSVNPHPATVSPSAWLL